jgi:gluconokinase
VLRVRIDEWLSEPGTVVLACSALTERIRDALGADQEGVHQVYLHGTKELIEARMREREHFMPPALLDSQFALLEPPEDVLDLDISQTPEELVARIVSELNLT